MVLMEKMGGEEEGGGRRGDKMRRKGEEMKKGEQPSDFCALTCLEEQVFDGYLLCLYLVHCGLEFSRQIAGRLRFTW